MTMPTILGIDPTVAASMAMLDQCRSCIEQLDDAAYVSASGTMFGASIGQHVRHSLDHFAAALAAVDGMTIDYDHRDRDTPVEKSRRAALDTISSIRDQMNGIVDGMPNQRVRVRVMLSGDGDEAQLTSTLARELAFAAHHAIHHHAMIAVIAREHGKPVPAGFGKAPSTIKHENNRA